MSTAKSGYNFEWWNNFEFRNLKLVYLGLKKRKEKKRKEKKRY